MLQLIVPAKEYYDEPNDKFIYTKEQTLQLEHSLVSISKWESKWHTPYLSKEQKTDEQILDYFRCMTITKNVDPLLYNSISQDQVEQISNYINDKMTATWINSQQANRSNRDIITSEVIYYWMIALEIPFECEKWHLTRLLMLIQVCNIKNAPAKKMGRKEQLRQNKALNASRKQKAGTRG